MKLNLLAFAVPLFVSIMLLEYYVSKRQRKKIFRFEESVANLNVGIAERFCDLLTSGAFFFVFSYIHNHYAIFEIKPTILTWVLLFLATDFVWYWYHRYAHEVNVFWSVHVVHHQSEDFNYTASVRVTVFQAIARGMFWSLLPLIGFPPDMIYILLLIHGTYPFFTHTQVVGKLGWLEYILVTPSHHRVHHSSNEEYLDKNYGDVLIIWDKMFGTFQKEEAAPTYGLTQPIASYSFLWQHFHFILEMLMGFRAAKGFKQKFRVLFGRPDNIDPRYRSYLERKWLSKKVMESGTRPFFNFILGQTLLTLLLLFVTILFEHYLTGVQLFLSGLFILLSVINTGAMLEQRKWIFHLEYARLAVVGLFIYGLFPNAFVASSVTAVLLITLLYYKTFSNRYRSMVYHI